MDVGELVDLLNDANQPLPQYEKEDVIHTSFLLIILD
jgi:hypothetical protein